MTEALFNCIVSLFLRIVSLFLQEKLYKNNFKDTVRCGAICRMTRKRFADQSQSSTRGEEDKEKAWEKHFTYACQEVNLPYFN